MKYILIIPDGIGDHPSESLSGKTPLDCAKIPNLHDLARIGKVGSAKLIPSSLELGAHHAALSLFGYEPAKQKTGIAPLEAANLEITMDDNEIAFRMNLITEADGMLADDTAGQISTKEAKALVAHLNKQLSSEFVRFFAGTGYRHIAVLKDAKGHSALSAKCIPPEKVLGKPVQSHLPTGNGAELLKKLMSDAKSLLEKHEVNQVRLDLKENPANGIWLWGQGVTPHLSKFPDRFQAVNGALISGVDYMKGLARLIGLTVVDVPGATGRFDTNIEAKADAMLDVLKEKDFVCVHIRSCDDASHKGNLKQKILSLEAIDYYVISAAKKFLDEEKEVRILICPFFVTPHLQRVHARDSVPFVVAGKNVVQDEIERYTESTARLSNFRVRDGLKLMNYLMTGKE